MATATTGPPAAPASLLGLPASWLLQLATTSALDWETNSRLALFRTCSFFRDAVAQHRRSHLTFNVPIAEERFQDEVDRLCTLARRSRIVALAFVGDRTPPAPWTETEPHITHLLVCAMARLGGEQPLAGIKRITLSSLQLTAPVPAWVRALCPNVESLWAYACTFAAWPERVNVIPHAANQPSSSTAPHPPAPVACSRLQSLLWVGGEELQQDDQPLLDLVRHQLAALPSLTHLHADWDSMALDQGGGGALSTSVTLLGTSCHGQPTLPQRLPALFPQLRELKLASGRVGDAELDGLLRHLGHVGVSFYRFDLRQSFTHRAWPWPHLTTWNLDVDSFARLPLHAIRSCSVFMAVQPSADAQALARVAEAVRRWGGLGQQKDGLSIIAEDSDAVITTLGPLLAALPEGQQRRVTLLDLGMGAVTPAFLQRLGAALPPGVERLSLSTSSGDQVPATWRALLPSLPATVEQVDLYSMVPTEQQLVDLCSAATRRIRVTVTQGGVSEATLVRVRARLAELGGGEQLVTLVDR